MSFVDQMSWSFCCLVLFAFWQSKKNPCTAVTLFKKAVMSAPLFFKNCFYLCFDSVVTEATSCFALVIYACFAISLLGRVWHVRRCLSEGHCRKPGSTSCTGLHN